MPRPRPIAAFVLGAALILSACGGSSGGATSAPGGGGGGATKAPGGGAATAAPAGGGGATTAPGGGGGGSQPKLGELKVDVAGDAHAYPIYTCGDDGKAFAVAGWSTAVDKDGAVLVIPLDGSTPSLVGAVNGTAWVIPDGKATRNGKSGEFSGTDVVTGKAIKGSFACTN